MLTAVVHDEPHVAPEDGLEDGPPATSEEFHLITTLRAGDEAAFTALVDRYHSALVRLALAYVATREVAEEVAQETWMGLLTGLDRFEGRCSLKTWIFRILVNRAKTRGQRERRSVPLSALEPSPSADDAAVDPDQFLPAGHQWAGHWASPPTDWEGMPEERLLSRELRDHIRRAMDALAPQQRQVMSLRDIEGWTAEEVRALLGITDVNQRVLLHRARAKVRKALEGYLSGERDPRAVAPSA